MARTAGRISLAVVENGVPVAGVVYAPARDEMYDASQAAAPDSTASRWSAGHPP